MKYSDVNLLVDDLGTKLLTFCGHHVDATHTSRIFDAVMRSIDYMSHETACVSLDFGVVAKATPYDAIGKDAMLTVFRPDATGAINAEILFC